MGKTIFAERAYVDVLTETAHRESESLVGWTRCGIATKILLYTKATSMKTCSICFQKRSKGLVVHK